jgi:hypothetical protein
MQDKLEASNLFLQGMWCDMVKLFMLQIICNDPFCKL